MENPVTGYVLNPGGMIRMRRSPSRARRIPYGLALLLTACSLPVTASGTDLQWLDALRELDRNHASVSALVVKLEDLSTIAALNPDRRLVPASVSKLFVTAGALKQFGPGHPSLHASPPQGP